MRNATGKGSRKTRDRELQGDVPKLATVHDLAGANEPVTGRKHPKQISASTKPNAKHRINLKAVSEALIEEGLDPAVEITRILKGEIKRDDKGKPVLHPVTGEPVREYLVDPDTRLRTLNEVLQYTQPKLKAIEVKMSGNLEITSEQLDERLGALLAKAVKR